MMRLDVESAPATAPSAPARHAEASSAQWAVEGEQMLRANHATFNGLVAQARRFVDAGDHAAAAAYTELAAMWAVDHPCGVFTSAELESILAGIADALEPRQAAPQAAGQNRPIKRILHVATAVQPIGGMSRMIWRWMNHDKEHVHSLVLTRQRQQIPADLLAAVRESGGSFHRLNTRPGGPLAWARRLRRIGEGADLIILHIGNRDVVPCIAFGGKTHRPPVLMLNHADHLFWLGADAVDLVVNLRASGKALVEARRGIARDRSILMPIIIEPGERTLSREAAKEMLGLPRDALMLMSAARAVKYRTFDGVTFLDAHVAFLKACPQAHLVVVGAGEREDWLGTIEAFQGRIIALPETKDISLYHQAADIYVDSFPFVSVTSLLEAGAYGTPLVTRTPFGPGAEVLSSDMPGLAHTMLRADTTDDYTKHLIRLASDDEYRRRLGDLTRREIFAHHVGNAWLARVQPVYEAARAISGRTRPHMTAVEPNFGKPDVYFPFVCGHDIDMRRMIAAHFGLLPPLPRARLSASALFDTESAIGMRDVLRAWVPEWVLARLAR